MDRFARPLFVCGVGLGLLVSASGCRSTKPEVPPGRSYTKDGQPKQAIQFSSEGHPTVSGGSAPYMQPNLGGSDIASGISGGVRPSGSAYGAPEGAYGAPGTSGSATPAPGVIDPSAIRSSAPAPSTGSIPLTGTPPSGGSTLPPLASPPAGSTAPSSLPDLDVSPPRDNLPAPNPVIQAPLDKPGVMGDPNALPSPM